MDGVNNMRKQIIELLERCSNTYYNGFGDFYKLTADDVKVLTEWANQRFQVDQEVNDLLFDVMYWKANNEWGDDKFFNNIGSPIETSEDEYGVEYKFSTPMGSMVELKEGDWDKWDEKINSFIYNVSEKLDGCSVILFYEQGNLIRAVSRGDGIVGKDITRHIIQIPNIPKIISNKESLTIRGELICPRAEIDEMLSDLKDETGKEYKNGRNTITGFLNQKKTLKSVVKHAHFLAYYIDISDEYNHADFDLLTSLGFETPVNISYLYNDLTEEKLIELVGNVKSTSKYECDGIIITSYDVVDGYEAGGKNPKCSRKFKLGATGNIAETIVKNITWQISRFGTFTPVLELEPVNLCGATISRCTAHNFKTVKENKIGVGSKIKFCRSGDVIPKFIETLTHSLDMNLPDIDFEEDGVDIRLKNLNNSEFLKEVKLQQLISFCKAMEIDCAGEGNLRILMDYFVDKFSRVLEIKDFLIFPETGLKLVIGLNGGKIYKSIHEKLANLSEPQMASACDIFGEGIGVTILQKVFDKYGTLIVTESQLKMVEGFGDIRIKQYINYVNSWKDMREHLLNIGAIFQESKKVDIKSDKYGKYIVCFTGVRDAELSKIIIENGGIASDSWSKNVNLLIAKDISSNSGKVQKARENNVEVISHEDAKIKFGC